MTLWKGTTKHDHGQITLSAPAPITLETIGQYYALPGVYVECDNSGFAASAAGVLTYNHAKGVFTLNGTADIQVNKACIITYGLYVNGGLIPGAETPHTFAASSKISTIAITAIMHLIRLDYIQVYARTDTANTLLTQSTLKVTLFGGRS